MQIHLHCSSSMMLQSERNSKQHPFHNACKRIAQEKPYIILHQTFLIIYLACVYVYRRSRTSPIIISTMYIHLHCSSAMKLRSERNSKQYSSHNACKRIAQEKPYNLMSDISDNLSCTRLHLSTLSHTTETNINYVDTSALQQLNDAAIRTEIEAIPILQCLQTYCTRKTLYSYTRLFT